MPWPQEDNGGSGPTISTLLTNAMTKLQEGINRMTFLKTNVAGRCLANSQPQHNEAPGGKHHPDGAPERVALYGEVSVFSSVVISTVDQMLANFATINELTHPGGGTGQGGQPATSTMAASSAPAAKPAAKPVAKPAAKPAPAPKAAPASKAATPPKAAAPAPKAAPAKPAAAPPAKKSPPSKGR